MNNITAKVFLLVFTAIWILMLLEFERQDAPLAIAFTGVVVFGLFVTLLMAVDAKSDKGDP